MNVPDGYTAPVPESGSALYLTYLILPVQRHYDDIYESAYTVPLLMSRN
jgi:hypothetical protein